MTKELVGDAWYDKFLKDEFQKPYFQELKSRLHQEYRTVKVYPAAKDIFKVFQLTDPNNVKVVILLQDPYPYNDSFGKPHADGLALSSPSSETPASLRVVLREVDRDVVKTNNLQEFKAAFPNNDLAPWVKQGVMLLNTALTVRAGIPNSHQELGWHEFIKNVLTHLINIETKKVFCLWGGSAKKLVEGMDFKEHKVLETGHPASGSHGKDLYSGSNHFSKINYYFWRNNETEINWKLI